MRIVAGFSGTAGDYFLTPAIHEPLAALQRQLWPWIEAWEQRFEARARRKRWSEGGLDDDDLAGDGFLKLLQRWCSCKTWMPCSRSSLYCLSFRMPPFVALIGLHLQRVYRLVLMMERNQHLCLLSGFSQSSIA